MEINVHKGLSLSIEKIGRFYVFKSLTFKGHAVIENVMTLAQCTETMSCFVSNYLSQELVYEHGQMSMKMVTKGKVIYLRIELYGKSLYFTKHDCKMVTSITNRVIARTDIFMNKGLYFESSATKKGS